MASGELDMEARMRGDHETVDRMRREAEQRSWQVHFGQVVLKEELDRIIDMIYPIGLMTCACRRSMRGLPDEENFTCVGMGPGMYKWERWPETYRGGMNFVTPEEAKDVFGVLNRRGLVHTVFTFGTPFLAGICNCDYPDCGALRNAIDLEVRVVWKGHHVAEIDSELCNGCGLCIKRCQFGALSFSPSTLKAYIDPFKCYGCGLCRNPCKPDAIEMVERAKLPAVAEVW